MRTKTPITENEAAAAKAYLAGNQTKREVAKRFKVTLPALGRALGDVAKVGDKPAQREAQSRDPSGFERAAREVAGACAECTRLRAMNGRLLRLLNELVTA